MVDPLVSVIIPTYNYAEYICEAIDSVLKQDYPVGNIEIIVIDDGSADNTKEKIQSYQEANLITYIFQENKGKANASNLGIQMAKGKYIFTLDADDYFYPDKIATSVKIFESDPQIVHVGTSYKHYHEVSGEFETENLPEEILEKPLDGNWVLNKFYHSNLLYGGGSTYAAKASVLKNIVIPDGVDMFIDEFLILALLPFGKSYFLRKPLSVWRVHSNNYSGKAASKEKQNYKEQRLLNSSQAVLNYLKNNNFSNVLIRIYQLKDLTRRIVFKESDGSKTIADIIRYAKEVFFGLKPNWTVVKCYNVLNRMIPSFALQIFKRQFR
jgi:glycosyltransferase involved in cell wall biosynthesis